MIKQSDASFHDLLSAPFPITTVMLHSPKSTVKQVKKKKSNYHKLDFDFSHPKTNLPLSKIQTT